MTDVADLEAGDVVVDREDDPRDRDEAIVVNTPPVRADQWEVGNKTVAEYGGNEDYPDDDPVVCVVYRPAFADTDPAPDSVDEPIPLRDLEVKHYTFPEARLRAVERSEEDAQDAESDGEAGDGGDTPDDTDEGLADGQRGARDTIADASDDLAAIAAAVRERNVDDVTVAQDAGVVRVEKLGLAYTIQRDGTVLDSGAFADALEDVAERAVADEADEDGEVAP